MRWSDAQQTMLRAMGLRLWLPGEAPEPVAAPEAVPEVRPVARLAAPLAGTVPASSPASPAAATTARAPTEAPAGQPSNQPSNQPIRQPIRQPVRPPTLAPIAGIAASGPGVRSAPSAWADLDWPALRSAVADCRACGLVDCRQQSVFGGGPLRAHCLIVGESQGEQEDTSGAPFAGDAGPLLDRMLRALGLSRAEAEPADSPPDPGRRVFVTNALKCRPPRHRNPSAEELAACGPFLQRQVALVQPRVIIAMGRFAVESMLGTREPLGRLRGRLHDWHGVPLVATFHPDQLLRDPAQKAKAWDDLCLAATCLPALAAVGG